MPKIDETMPVTLKRCQDCLHCIPSGDRREEGHEWYSARCAHESALKEPEESSNPLYHMGVDGALREQHLCITARSSRYSERCGKKAKHFEPRPQEPRPQEPLKGKHED